MAIKNPYGENVPIPPETPIDSRRTIRIPTLFDRLIVALVWLFLIGVGLAILMLLAGFTILYFYGF